jgi:ATP-dependent DNA helicase RecQ
MRTALTYLELGGVLKQGTPFYAGYEVRFHESQSAAFAEFGDKGAKFLRDLFQTAKQGRIWWKIDPDEIMEALGCTRPNIVRAMELLEEKAVAEVRAADSRQRYHRLREGEDVDALVDDLIERFARREKSEIKRIGDVLKLVEYNGCQTNALVGYFGEKRAKPCGHCSWCATGKAATLPPSAPAPAPDERISREALTNFAPNFPAALATPRQQARFLCGLGSPAQTKAKLGTPRLVRRARNRALSRCSGVVRSCLKPVFFRRRTLRDLTLRLH